MAVQFSKRLPIIDYSQPPGKHIFHRQLLSIEFLQYFLVFTTHNLIDYILLNHHITSTATTTAALLRRAGR